MTKRNPDVGKEELLTMPLLLVELHPKFLNERLYLDNVSPRTIRFLKQSWNAFTKFTPDAVVVASDITPDCLNGFIFALRDSGNVGVVTVNTYIRGVNTFLSWLANRGDIAIGIRMKQLRVGVRLPKTVEPGIVTRLVGFKPDCMSLARVHAVVCTVLDTGLRINEVSTLTIDALNLDDMVMRVIGKGDRERLVPFSPELRRILYRWMLNHNADPRWGRFVFGTSRAGLPPGYRNLVRDYEIMCGRLGIPRPGGFHRLRHTFASGFMRSGGNQFYLKAILGHTTLKTTDIYVHCADAGSLRSRTTMLR